MLKILLIEDEYKTAISVRDGLASFDIDIAIAHNGIDAKEMILNEDFSLIICDIILPDCNGLTLMKEIKADNPDVPVIFLSALNDTDDIILGLEVGADDYLSKPFALNELNARIHAVLRRTSSKTPKPDIIYFHDLELNSTAKTFKRDSQLISLSPKEFELIKYLIENENRVISKKEIAEKVWNINFDTGTNTIEVYVNYLRNKIDKNYPKKLIHTVHGIGYILSENY